MDTSLELIEIVSVDTLHKDSLIEGVKKILSSKVRIPLFNVFPYIHISSQIDRPEEEILINIVYIEGTIRKLCSSPPARIIFIDGVGDSLNCVVSYKALSIKKKKNS